MLYTKKTFEYEERLNEADIALLGIPWDCTETGSPVRFGPVFIREAIKNLPGWDPELRINIFEKFRFADLGDLEIVHSNWNLTGKRIKDTIKEMFQENPGIFPVFLGGDHLITLGILDSLSEILKKKITVIDFDAHRDLASEWLGEPYNHLTWAYHLLQNRNIELVQIGCRSWSREEERAFSRIKNRIEKTKNPVYITVDMDVFDPRFAPEVGTPEPLGMNAQDFFALLKQACRNRVVGLDIVECASDRPNTQTAVLAANIFKKVIGGTAALGKSSLK